MRHSILAVELCLRLEPGHPLREQLHRLVIEHPARSTPSAKWRMYTQAAGLLRQNLALAQTGCWDFFEDDARALKDFDMWSNGMLTEEGARPGPSGMPDPFRGEPRFMTFTLALLIAFGSASERALSRACAIPQADLWKRASFDRVLDSVRVLSFASVKSDVAYVIPGDPSWGLTAQDLQHEKFHYLRVIE